MQSPGSAPRKRSQIQAAMCSAVGFWSPATSFSNRWSSAANNGANASSTA
jgi:hypothetical protein